MKRIWLLITLIVSLPLLSVTQDSILHAQEVGLSTYQVGGSSTSWVTNEPKDRTYTTSTLDDPIYGYGATIYSPCNRTYDSNEAIIIKASSPTLGGSNIIYKGTYTIDDGVPHKLNTESVQTRSWDPFFGALIGTATLPKLAEGSHKITVYLETYIGTSAKPTVSGEATVYFTILDITPPNIILNSINNVVFNQTSVPLNFTVDELTTCTAYSIDNGAQVTIEGNTTLNVAAGNHTLAVFAIDTAGNTGQSEVASFIVQTSQGTIDTQANGSIILVVATVSAIIVVVAVWLGLVHKRGRGKKNLAMALHWHSFKDAKSVSLRILR